jgi:hypothetical protein
LRQSLAFRRPAITEKDDAIARFMSENPDSFGAEVEYTSERNVAAPLSKMMIGRFRNRVQGNLDSFLSI